MLCDLSGTVIVSVDYRLAPEHRFPSGLEDCYASTVWAVEKRKRRWDATPASWSCPARAPVATSRRRQPCWRDRGRDRRSHTRSSSIPTSTWLVTCLSTRARSSARHPPSLQWMVGLYLREERDVRNPLVSPIFGDLRGLPPALIFTAENDPLREQGQAYAKELRRAGVRSPDGELSRSRPRLLELPEPLRLGRETRSERRPGRSRGCEPEPWLDAPLLAAPRGGHGDGGSGSSKSLYLSKAATRQSYAEEGRTS